MEEGTGKPIIEAVGAAIVEIVRAAGSEGLDREGILEALKRNGIPFSIRGINAALSKMVDEGKLKRERLRTGRPGRPSFKYVHPDNVSMGPLFDLVKFIPKEEISHHTLPPEERRRLEEEYGWIAQVGLDHLEQEETVRAIKEAVPHLVGEPPIPLIVDMADWLVGRIREERRELLRAVSRGDSTAYGRHLDHIERLTRFGGRYFQGIFRLDPPFFEGDGGILYLPDDRRKLIDPAVPDEEIANLDRKAAEETLRKRIFGERFAEVLKVDLGEVHAAAATDASVAQIVVKVHGRGAYELPETVGAITSAAALHVRISGGEESWAKFVDYDIDPDLLRKRDEYGAIKEGLILTPSAAEWLGLTEGRFAHAQSGAMDLRQYLRDLDVMQGRVLWRLRPPLSGRHPEEPELVPRDGRLFPVEHKLTLYEDPTLYGDLVRNQIRAAANAVNYANTFYRKIVYAAVVKEPELSILAPLVFWYVCVRRSDPRIPEERIFMPRLGDPIVAHLVLAAARERKPTEPGSFVVTFRILRRFADIADLKPPFIMESDGSRRRIDEDRESDWDLYFDTVHRLREERYRRGEERTPPLERRDYEEFALLCKRMAALMFFALPQDGRFPGHNPVRLPRYEILTRPDVDPSGHDAVRRFLSWLADPDALILDQDHFPLFHSSGTEVLPMPRLLPAVVSDAHRAATAADTEYGSKIQEEIMRFVSEVKRRYGGGR